jgi:hypothetical protein
MGIGPEGDRQTLQLGRKAHKHSYPGDHGGATALKSSSTQEELAT